MSVRVVCQQLAPRIGDLEANRRRSVEAIREAVALGGEVVVLPELVTSGYVFESRAEAASVAVGLDHPLFDEWVAAVAGSDAIVVAGFCEQGIDGNLYNSAALVTGSGVQAVHRKLHLWDREKLVFEPGLEQPPIVATRVGRIALLVCYDLEFPELTRAVALAGAQLIAVPTNWPRFPRPDGERPPEVIAAMAAARINRVAIAMADRCGSERGQEWMRGTTIVGPDGWVAAESSADGALVADLDLSVTLDKRMAEHADLFGDRRPELYRSVVEGEDHAQC